VEECKALGGGLAALESRKYKMAARKFTELGVELGRGLHSSTFQLKLSTVPATKCILNTPYYPLTPHKEPLNNPYMQPPIPQQALTLSREVDECKPLELGNSYEEVISPQDVATYGGLCALASLDRKELKERVLDNITFRAALEARPASPQQ
jgi:hypothetical protein